MAGKSILLWVFYWWAKINVGGYFSPFANPVDNKDRMFSMLYKIYMSPLADAFHGSFDMWFTELFGQLNFVGNFTMWTAEVIAFFVLMQS